jgi:RNA polymerase sigma-70 factor (ECF subfamily)
VLLAAEEAESEANSESQFPDERLKLMLICAHPAIEPSVRTPLILQTVLGLDAARIASAFLISPKAMSARLVRAKRKIKEANIPFTAPSLDVLPERLSAVLDAIYAAFGTGWNDFDGAEDSAGGLTLEAIFLAKLLTTLSPDEAEAWGLLSLMLHAEARRNARRDDGAYVSLKDQDTRAWDKTLIAKAEEALAKAWRLDKPGRFQIEAAIQSAHAASRLQDRDVTEDVILLYQRLIELAPTLGAQTGFAAALSNGGRDEDALTLLDGINDHAVSSYQPYWAVRAHILGTLNRNEEARGAYERAIGLASDISVRAFLHHKKKAL